MKINNLIARYDNNLDNETCIEIYKYVLLKKGIEKEHITISNMPWHEGDTLAYDKIDDERIKEKIKLYKYKLADLVSTFYNIKTYPHFTDLVLWREGRSMARHRDNGYDEKNNVFAPRIYSSVTYINDDYHGGETIISQLNNEDFISQPKMGSTIIFTSDERCEHRVNKVIKGLRVTLPIWFSIEKQYEEKE